MLTPFSSSCQLSSAYHSTRPETAKAKRICTNPEECARRARVHQTQMDRYLPKALADYEILLDLPDPFTVSEHADQRMEERSISFREIVEVLQCYQPVEFYHSWMPQHSPDEVGRRFLFHPYSIVVTGETELSGRGRNLAIWCTYTDDPVLGDRGALRIRTAYEPDDGVWSPDLTHRTCFCKGPLPEKEGVETNMRRYLQTQKTLTVYSSY